MKFQYLNPSPVLVIMHLLTFKSYVQDHYHHQILALIFMISVMQIIVLLFSVLVILTGYCFLICAQLLMMFGVQLKVF